MTSRIAGAAGALVFVLLTLLGGIRAADARVATRPELFTFAGSLARDLGGVQIAGGYVEWPWAIVSWRSTDQKRHGQALLYHRCDHWHFEAAFAGTITARQIGAVTGDQPTKPTATALATDALALARTAPATYITARATSGC